MVLNFGKDEKDDEAFSLFSKNESVPEGIFVRIREQRKMFDVPTATTAKITKTKSGISTINSSAFAFPDEGSLQLKYAIDYNLDNDIYEWSNEDGIIVQKIEDSTLLRADGGTFPSMYVLTSQEDEAYNTTVYTDGGAQEDGLLINDMNLEIEVIDQEAPLTDHLIFNGDLGSIETINNLWMKVRVDIYAGAGNTQVKLQTSINNVDWTTHQDTTSNTDFTVEKNVKDVSIRYFRVLLTAASNDQHAYFNMIAWK